MNIYVESLLYLRDVAREFETCEFVEGPIFRRFDPEGVFVAHLNFDGYTNIPKIFVPQERKENRIPEIVVNTNAK